MMKKLLSLFLAALILIPAIAFAGEPYVNENPYYAYNYPNGWVAADQKTIDNMLELGADAIQNSMAAPYLEMVKEMGIVMFMSPRLKEFAVVMPQEIGMDMDVHTLVAMFPILAQQMGGMLEGAKVVSDGEVINAGGNAFAKMVMTMPVEGTAVTMGMYLMSSGGVLFIFIYGCQDGDQNLDAFEGSLASFTTVK